MIVAVIAPADYVDILMQSKSDTQHHFTLPKPVSYVTKILFLRPYVAECVLVQPDIEY